MILVLAAGMGSRYGGNKQLDSVGPNGETIIDYSIFDARRAGFGKIIFVIRRDIEKQFVEQFMKPLSGEIQIDYVFQDLDKHLRLNKAGLIADPFAVGGQKPIVRQRSHKFRQFR